MLDCIVANMHRLQQKHNAVRDGFYHLKYKELNHKENSTNSLTTIAGDPIPNTGTMSTRSQDSTNPPSKAPDTSPPIVIRAAFPEDMTTLEVKMRFSVDECRPNNRAYK